MVKMFIVFLQTSALIALLLFVFVHHFVTRPPLYPFGEVLGEEVVPATGQSIYTIKTTDNVLISNGNRTFSWRDRKDDSALFVSHFPGGYMIRRLGWVNVGNNVRAEPGVPVPPLPKR